ncbi:hypothetical protein SPC_3657 [Salmonella enterica subsp. enterica serovar Paratyphi C str. RKS4594]|uniref:Uncharacterized protein n=1 Tax=Salmonella paratyphi C (strain RKS4594) TaxID=476213 RepID=C0Q142_SALPC|nr:hypothetical protein SPC_3657 [Salmonella enterica subsp. enterica serovar Paratyphi C str. RKS4594]
MSQNPPGVRLAGVSIRDKNEKRKGARRRTDADEALAVKGCE